ncbi:MAG: GIY-YIG nuclease family protein [Acidobacteriia bacterium]|nr:GIY-YIG nuclease family protein [Terriglobia bacterium]
MSSKSGTLYTGMTNSIYERVMQHRAKQTPGFTGRYDVTRLVYYEAFNRAMAAIRREKQIKGWTRKKKIALIESINPRWKDLSEGWGELLPTRPWQVRDPLADERAKEDRSPKQRRDHQQRGGSSGPKSGPSE